MNANKTANHAAMRATRTLCVAVALLYRGFRSSRLQWGRSTTGASAVDPSVSHYKRVLWTVLAVNAAMFVVEIGVGLMADSAPLQADAADFLISAPVPQRRS